MFIRRLVFSVYLEIHLDHPSPTFQSVGLLTFQILILILIQIEIQFQIHLVPDSLLVFCIAYTHCVGIPRALLYCSRIPRSSLLSIASNLLCENTNHAASLRNFTISRLPSLISRLDFRARLARTSGITCSPSLPPSRWK